MQYVSPAQRHVGEDHVILKARHAVYLAVQQYNPARWSEKTCNWTLARPLTFKPERDSIVDLAASTEGISQKAA